MSEGTLRTPACHRGLAEERTGSKLFWARPVREWVTVHCVYPAALAPADRPQESESPWCTGICWALSLIARLSPFRMSVWPRKAQRKRSWGWEEPLLAWVKSHGSLITQRQLIKVDLPLVLQPLLKFCEEVGLATNDKIIQKEPLTCCDFAWSKVFLWVRESVDLWDNAAVVPASEQDRGGCDYCCHDFNRWLWRPLQESGGENNFFYLGVVSMATPLIIQHPEQTIPLANKSTWRGRDGNLAGIVVQKFQASRTGDLALSRR